MLNIGISIFSWKFETLMAGAYEFKRWFRQDIDATSNTMLPACKITSWFVNNPSCYNNSLCWWRCRGRDHLPYLSTLKYQQYILTKKKLLFAKDLRSTFTSCTTSETLPSQLSLVTFFVTRLAMPFKRPVIIYNTGFRNLKPTTFRWQYSNNEKHVPVTHKDVPKIEKNRYTYVGQNRHNMLWRWIHKFRAEKSESLT